MSQYRIALSSSRHEPRASVLLWWNPNHQNSEEQGDKAMKIQFLKAMHLEKLDYPVV